MAVIALRFQEQFSRALGEAVVRIWGRLPPRPSKPAVRSGRNNSEPKNQTTLGRLCP